MTAGDGIGSTSDVLESFESAAPGDGALFAFIFKRVADGTIRDTEVRGGASNFPIGADCSIGAGFSLRRACRITSPDEPKSTQLYGYSHYGLESTICHAVSRHDLRPERGLPLPPAISANGRPPQPEPAPWSQTHLVFFWWGYGTIVFRYLIVYGCMDLPVQQWYRYPGIISHGIPVTGLSDN